MAIDNEAPATIVSAMATKDLPAAPHLDVGDLREVARRTLAHYDGSAATFWEGTRDHDVTQNYAALLDAISNAAVSAPYRILDFGCGPGRDLAYFRKLGHEPIGVEGSARFVEMARQHSECEVWHQDFLALSLPSAHFDGVFANASLFHVPSQELARVLRELRGTLKPGGILFSSNPRGEGSEGWNGDRYGAYHSVESWTAIVAAQGFELLSHYYRPPGKPRDEQPWLATVWKKAEA